MHVSSFANLETFKKSYTLSQRNKVMISILKFSTFHDLRCYCQDKISALSQ